MKNIFKVLILVVLVIIVYFFIKNSRKETYFKPVSLSTRNTIINNDTKPFMDTIVSVGLDILNVNNCNIVIKSMDDNIKNKFLNQNDLNLQAAIFGKNGMYYIFIDNINRNESITVLSHELVHLEQYNSGNLEAVGNGIVIWKGNKINVIDIPYEQRPWEIDAFNKQGEVASKINKIIY
jgi:predicted metallopeptidase